MPDFLRVAEPVAGALLYLVVMVDLLLTVLYARLGGRGVARLGAGVIANCIGRGVRRVLIALGTAIHRRDAVLSFCGPVTIILLPFTWTWLLTIASALVIHPLLGSTIVAQQGASATDFITALYAAGTSLAITGSSEYIPANDFTRFLFLANAVSGTSLLTLTITYLMQVYPALQRRNSLGVTIHVYTGRTGDAARLVAAFLPQGDVTVANSNLANLGQTMLEVSEGYHFYPVLFYFRPHSIEYADIRFVTVALDAVTLMRTALDDALTRRVAGTAPVLLLRDAAAMLSTTLEATFIDEESDGARSPSSEEATHWRARFLRACEFLASQEVPLAADRDAAARRYVEERARWQPRLDTLGRYATYGRDEIDPALWSPAESPIMGSSRDASSNPP
jgi:hypothetical protein